MGQAIGQALNVTELVFPLLPPSYDASHKLLVYFPTEADTNVPAMLLAPQVEDRSKLGPLVSVCVIYFHPNACDIGESVEDLEAIRDGAFDGDAVLLAPEYPGYGLLSGYEPSVAGIDRVGHAAWRFCLEGLGFSADQVILWGRSIGCGPAAALAHRVACRPGSPKGPDAVVGDQGPSPKGTPTPSPAVTPRDGSRQEDAAAATGEGAVGTAEASPAEKIEFPDGSTRPAGGIVLLAPFLSVSSIVMAHYSSPVIASLVSPMWEVGSMLTEPGLADVPLCVLHPKGDELIPASHGKAVLQGASSRLKFGLWLVGATHNFLLEEEHLTPVRDFLFEHLAFRGTSLIPTGDGETSPRGGAEGDGPRDVDSAECMDLVARLTWWGASGRAEKLLVSV
eukprot:gnl/TRDRNA2_/TRDRNA2_88966_c0_seq1.p1 gnl/TRDRNA2_/TRDRNA2_88966_c0~~gnl/TRDRNA2_/TRDRNA2_88966_c0_seq1.p1  ORF type:complete len:394 (+),score=57.88 gnl/TRDRNA2_/TRDRNA2_88966_c0_seq1:168-1349(+)